MGNGERPPRLPEDAPQSLKDFVACTVTTVELDTDSMDWVPSGGMGDVAPSVTLEPGDTARTADVRVGWEYVGLDLPASISDDGELVVDTSGIPSFVEGVRDGVDEWVRAFNATMTANDKRLDSFTVTGTTVAITKRSTAAAAEPAAVPPVVTTSPGPAGATQPPGTGEPSAELEPSEGSSTNWGCLAWLLGAAVVLVLLVVGIFVLTGDGDDATDEIATEPLATDQAATDPAVTEPLPTEPAPTAPPSTEPVATDPPVTEPATTEPATTEPAATEPATDADTGTRDGAGVPDPFGGIFDELDDAFVELGLTGRVVFASPGLAGDVVDCNAQTPVDVVGADVVGVVGTTDGTTTEVAVLMNQSPQSTAEDFSFAVLLQVLTRGNVAESYQWEIHDGEQSVGRRDEAGNVDPAAADISLDERAVRFGIPVDPDDPIAVLFARGFNTPSEGDATACDAVIAAPTEFPVPPTDVAGTCQPDETTACLNNDRFAATVTGPGGAVMTTATGLDDTAAFGDDDGAAWVRLLNGCSFNDHFWVFTAASTAVEWTVTVTDTAAGDTFSATLQGRPAPAITDTTAFATCP